MTQFTKLFEPINIGRMKVKNRIVFPPLGTRFASADGEATERHVEHYRSRAKGGTGLLIVPWVLVDTKIQRKTGRLRLDSDEYIRGLNEIVKTTHMNDAKIAIQLSHGGRAVTSEEANNTRPVSASEAYCSPYGTTARALTIGEIEYLEEAFAKAAYRAKLAEFDAVEFHAASGYLISQFLSPYINKRTDNYGGDAERRTNFLLEIIEKTRELVGKEFPLIVRISGDEFVEGGLTLKDNKFISKKLVEAGVDCIDVTMGIVESYHKAMPPMAVPPAAYSHLAEGIKQVVDVPVITVGRINEPVLAERLLKENKADMIAMARAILADPELPRKAMNGNLDDIVPCIYCNRCEMATSQNVHITCTVNPRVGNEGKYRISPANKIKHVLVIGGGPAGMTAATIAKLRGHRVELIEKEDRLGGQLNLSTVPPHKEELERLGEYLITQNRKAGVKTILGRNATAKDVLTINPEVVILATGATQTSLNIPGIDGKNVVYAWDILRGEADTKDNIVVIGGGMVGCETADYLAEKGKKVKIIEMLPEVGLDMEPFTKIFLLERFKEFNVLTKTSLKVIEIHEGFIQAVDEKWNRQTINGDTMVVSVGSEANNILWKDLKGNIKELYKVGDCKEPQKLLEAIHEATRIANKI